MRHWTEKDKGHITVHENPGEISSSLLLLSFPQTAVYSYFLLKAVSQNGGIEVTEEFDVTASSLSLWLLYPSSVIVTYSKRISKLTERLLEPCLVHHACTLDHAHAPAPCISHAHERVAILLRHSEGVAGGSWNLTRAGCQTSCFSNNVYIYSDQLWSKYTLVQAAPGDKRLRHSSLLPALWRTATVLYPIRWPRRGRTTFAGYVTISIQSLPIRILQLPLYVLRCYVW